MNNPTKQINFVILFSFLLGSLLIAGEPNRKGGGPGQWGPADEAEKLRNESRFLREKMEKGSPEFKEKARQVIDLNEKIAVQLEKKADAMKKKNPKMVEQAHKECEKLWTDKMKAMEECKRAHEKMSSQDREHAKMEMKADKKEFEKKEGSHSPEGKQDAQANNEKSKEVEKADQKNWPAYE